MNTNSVPLPPDAVDSVLHVVPPSWRPWVVVAVSLGPWLSRFGYAMYAGRGMFGAVHGLLFGTNSTKEQGQQSGPADAQKP